MYASLYSRLNPLVKAKKSGTLEIDHENGVRAFIYMKKGRIEGIEKGPLTGQEAGRDVAMWISFSADFSEKEHPMGEHVTGLDTDSFLEYLLKAEKKATQIQRTIPLNGDTVKLELAKMKGRKSFNSKELKVAMALDGKTPVKKIVSESGIPDLEALHYIHGFCRQGLAKIITANEPLEEKVRATFMDSLIETVSDLVGPAAEIIVKDAFEYLDSEPALIYQSELPLIIEAIARSLDEDDAISLKKWGLRILKNM